MTAKEVYRSVLVEMNKTAAPSILLEDFNYFFNKAIYQYINKKYNVYDTNQQSTDDMRVLRSTALLKPSISEAYNSISSTTNSLYGAVYETNLPSDYLHILNCVCNFKVLKTYACYDKNTYVQMGARRLTSDLWSQVIRNFYMQPSYRNPYYFINNVNTSTIVPTNRATDMDSTHAYYVPQDKDVDFEASKTNITNKLISNPESVTLVTPKGEEVVGTDFARTLEGDLNGVDWEKTIKLPANSSLIVSHEEHSNFPRQITIGEDDSERTVSAIEREAAIRYGGNVSPVRLEIRYGKDNKVFELTDVFIDYIKVPQNIRLTQEQIEMVEDTSQVMEFPDYVCQEIINELAKLLLENASDPRLQTNIAVNQSIAPPAQQLAPQQQNKK